MKSIICLLALFLALPQAEAHNYKALWQKKIEYYKKHAHSHHHSHSKSCGHQSPAPGPVCTDEERVENGDFESDDVTNSNQWQLLSNLTGWKIHWATLGCCRANPLAELQSFPSEQLEGSTQYIELDSHYQSTNHCSSKTNIGIYQYIDAKVGETLKLEFNYKPRSLAYGKMELFVMFGDDYFTLGNFTNTAWKKFSKEYKVTSKDVINGKMLLWIKDSGLPNTYGMFVDNVSVKATNCTPAPKLCTSAASVVAYSPLGLINGARKNSSKSLGLPDGEPVNESNIKFASLGFGGSMILKLDNPVKNVFGPDLRIWESTAGNQTYSQYQEAADVYVSANGVNWVYAGRVQNDNNDEAAGMVDIGLLDEALYVKIVDKSQVVSGRDGFDVDAVTCLNQVNEFQEDFYYVDNATKKIYQGALDGESVFLKEFMPSPFSMAHISQSYFDTLIVVEAAGEKRIKGIDLETKAATDMGKFNFLGNLDQVYANEGFVWANHEGTNKIYIQESDSNTTSLFSTVLHNGKPLLLKGGDLHQTLFGVLYVVTNQNGGSLYSLQPDLLDESVMHATLVVNNLGTVTGLISLSTGEMLVSLLDSSSMKVVDIFSRTVRSVSLKGDLKKQGTKGGDLSRYDTL
jgi:hypothetical protein